MPTAGSKISQGVQPPTGSQEFGPMLPNRALTLNLVLSFCAGIAAAQPARETLVVTNNQSGSVTSFRVANDGSLQIAGVYPAGPMPQDCAISPDGKRLVVLNSNIMSTGPEVVSLFTINSDSTLKPVASSATVGDASLAVSISRSGFALTTSTATDTISSFRLADSGLTPASNALAGAFPLRPLITPDSSMVICSGSVSPDDIVSYRLGSDGRLTRLASVDIPSASAFGGVLHPSGRTLYVSTGQLNSIRRYDINPANGAMTFRDSTSIGGNSVVELAMHPQGTWLFSAHVQSDEVRVTRINADGSLTPTPYSALIRSDVRDVTTNGRFLFITDETQLGFAGPGVFVYRINNDTGEITSIGAPFGTSGLRPQYMALWSPTECPGDADRNGIVNFADVTATLNNQGSAGPFGDADFDGDVDFNDVSAILRSLGPCASAQ